MRPINPFFMWFCLMVAGFTLLLAMQNSANSAPLIPHQAYPHRAALTRAAQQTWGLNAPVATFAAQVHQESGWQNYAHSNVGALGMAQFMPQTATWWCRQAQINRAQCIPTNPTWALRALVGYDKWLFDRVWGSSERDRMWAALRAYNGGLGNWQDEAKKAKNQSQPAIDAACGKANRHKSFCGQNIGYPVRIINIIQPAYLAWGRGV